MSTTLAPPAPSPVTRRAKAAQPLPAAVLTTALGLSLWVATGSLVLAVADGLGHHPARRLTVGLLLVLGSTAALWQRRQVSGWLQARPWLVLPVAATELLLAALDGVVGGPYMAFTLTAVGVAVVVARPRTVWACALLLSILYGLAVLIGHSPASLDHDGDLAGVIGQLLGYPFAALSLLGLAGLFQRFENNAALILDEIRAAPALTPALTQAIAGPAAHIGALPAAEVTVVRLTPAEIRVVEGLAAGKAPKELAHDWGVKITTVRTHIKHAKRKTGARTVPELAACAAHPDWPEVTSSGD
jgi:DNA-binding CsgD family transcriptional regulator